MTCTNFLRSGTDNSAFGSAGGNFVDVENQLLDSKSNCEIIRSEVHAALVAKIKPESKQDIRYVNGLYMSRGMCHDLVPQAFISRVVMIAIAICRMVTVNDEVEQKKSFRDRFEDLYLLPIGCGILRFKGF